MLSQKESETREIHSPNHQRKSAISPSNYSMTSSPSGGGSGSSGYSANERQSSSPNRRASSSSPPLRDMNSRLQLGFPHVPPSVAALHAAAAGAFLHGKNSFLNPMVPPGSLAGLTGMSAIPEAYHGLYMSHPAAAAAAAAMQQERALHQQHVMPPSLHSQMMAHRERQYVSSPPPISSTDPSANECKLVDYRGHKVAAFVIHGETMLCLPQAFELFLKHLVGGLHTVYTKLKRLDIVPLVCNVEQVRILRGLGAIQPGVNRCKLLSCKDFDALYRDCTTARPGRPPKRSPLLGNSPSSSQTEGFKKPRIESDYSSAFQNGRTNEGRYDKALLGTPPSHLHPMQLMAFNAAAAQQAFLGNPGSLHHPGLVGMIHQQPQITQTSLPAHLESQRQEQSPNEPNARTGFWENCRAAYEDAVKHFRLKEEKIDCSAPQQATSHSSKGERNAGEASSRENSPALNLSKTCEESSIGGEDSNSIEERSPVHEIEESETSDQEGDHDTKTVDAVAQDHVLTPVSEKSHVGVAGNSNPQQAMAAAAAYNYSTLLSAAAAADPSLVLASTETLLCNIQGLLKLAADNARDNDHKSTYEKAKLKMELVREREAREKMEKQLEEEKKIKVVFQRRFRKERRLRRRIQEQLGELERRMGIRHESPLGEQSAEQPTRGQVSLDARIRLNDSHTVDTSQTSQLLHSPMNGGNKNSIAFSSHQHSQSIENDIKSGVMPDPRSLFFKNSVLYTSAS
ncbi:dachshund homolog 1-like isoform X2 [Artemia franciscana]|uniref:dachshund homolog 1-like isoform X2 n=1 Tax=Artemia franciscana TaxID=6661 RepID=UPI0032DBA4F9